MADLTWTSVIGTFPLDELQGVMQDIQTADSEITVVIDPQSVRNHRCIIEVTVNGRRRMFLGDAKGTLIDKEEVSEYLLWVQQNLNVT